MSVQPLPPMLAVALAITTITNPVGSDHGNATIASRDECCTGTTDLRVAPTFLVRAPMGTDNGSRSSEDHGAPGTGLAVRGAAGAAC